MRLVYTLIILLGTSLFLNSQEGNCNLEVNKKAMKIYLKGIEKIKISRKEGRDLIKQAVEIDPQFLEAHYFLGNFYFDQVLGPRAKPMRTELKSAILAKSRKYFKEVHRICPDFSGHTGTVRLGIIGLELDQPDIAVPYFKYYLEHEKEPLDDFKNLAEKVIRTYATKDDLMSNPVSFDPSEVRGVNTAKDEFLPMLTPDNEMIYFTRRVPNRTDDNPFFEQLMESRLVAVDSFSNAIAVQGPFAEKQLVINGRRVLGKGGVTITPDNKHLFVTLVMLDYEKTIEGKIGHKHADIYYSDKINGSWSDLRSIGQQINNVGGFTWEGQPTISSDGNMIVFASAREESTLSSDDGNGVPTMDLYYTVRSGKSWTAAKGLGNVINTSGNEKTPFLHTDSKTLYFSSNGHRGMGGYDIYFSRMDTAGEWSHPENIGYPINTEEDEHSFIVSLDGKLGYLAAGEEQAEDGKALQIISFPIPEQAKPKKVVMMKGTMKDSDGNVVRDGKIEIKNTKTGEKTEAYVDGNTGEYVAIMAVEEDTEEIEVNGEVKEVKVEDTPPTEFILTAKKEGSAFSSKSVVADPDDIDGAKKIRGEEIKVDPIEENKPYRLNDLVFNTGSYDLTKSAINILDEFIEFLKFNKAYNVKIQGHTDNQGDDNKNLVLSDNRAKSVKAYLISKGIEESRLSAKGYGETKPIADNNTSEGRAKNRRTEFLLRK